MTTARWKYFSVVLKITKIKKKEVSLALKEEITSVFEALLDELDDLVEVEGNVGLWDVQQLQPFVLDPKRPDQRQQSHMEKKQQYPCPTASALCT